MARIKADRLTLLDRAFDACWVAVVVETLRKLFEDVRALLDLTEQERSPSELSCAHD